MLLSATALATMMATTCPVPQFLRDFVPAIARVESGYHTLAIHDNTTGRSYFPGDKNNAIATARALSGHSLDIGLMQINTANFPGLGLTLDAAFEACPSLRAGHAILTEALSRYNTGKPDRGIQNGYVQRVMAARASLASSSQEASTAPAPVRAIVVSPHNWNIYADTRDHSMFSMR